MKLTIEEVAQLTGLAPRTVGAYARRLGLGSKEGRRKYFTKAEAKQIGSGTPAKPEEKKHIATGRPKATATKTKRP